MLADLIDCMLIEVYYLQHSNHFLLESIPKILFDSNQFQSISVNLDKCLLIQIYSITCCWLKAISISFCLFASNVINLCWPKSIAIICCWFKSIPISHLKTFWKGLKFYKLLGMCNKFSLNKILPLTIIKPFHSSMYTRFKTIQYYNSIQF